MDAMLCAFSFVYIVGILLAEFYVSICTRITLIWRSIIIATGSTERANGVIDVDKTVFAEIVHSVLTFHRCFKIFGYFTYNQVHESRVKLADAYSDFKVNATAIVDIQWEGATKRFLEWRWKFSARNLFKVDRNLVRLTGKKLVPPN
ncbi:unnamed protein product [Allacma fusca]|uniref:Uncharacterized protein n=1 Tax=Allacma fusca TaxID=39272 RepID=A0A8J2KBJ6_9HEXA|nr:unnamed protein product [Allacma fusca]